MDETVCHFRHKRARALRRRGTDGENSRSDSGHGRGRVEPTSLQGWIFQTIFAPLAEPINASLAYAVCYVLIWLCVMWLLYRKNIFIKV